MAMYGRKLPGDARPSMTFDSIKEYERWNTLRLLQYSGAIQNLRRQVPFIISEETKYRGETLRKIEYKADFTYIKDGETVVEDVKAFDEAKGSFRTTEAFDLKWKLAGSGIIKF